MKIKGVFNIESYSISHKELKIRHSQHYEVEEVLQLIFIGVFFIQLPNFLDDFDIYEGNEDDKNYIENQMQGFQIDWNFEKVFVINSNNNTYFIGASSFRVMGQNGAFTE